MVNIANHHITVAFICYKKFSCYLVYTHKSREAVHSSHVHVHTCNLWSDEFCLLV